MKKENKQKSGVRVNKSTKDLERDLIEKANKLSSFGGKIFSEDLYEYALKLVTDKHLKELKISKITGDDYDKLLLQKFKEKDLGQTSSEFRNFQRTSEWPKFIKEHKPENLLKEMVLGA